MFQLFFSKRLSSPSDLKLHFPLFLPHQVHGDEIFYVDYNNLNQKINADACITDKKAIAVGIRTADCLPVLMYDEVKSIVAAIHSGWKGTVKRIVSKTIFFMIKSFKSNPLNIKVFIGPSICGRCYYVVSALKVTFYYDFGFWATALSGIGLHIACRTDMLASPSSPRHKIQNLTTKALLKQKLCKI